MRGDILSTLKKRKKEVLTETFTIISCVVFYIRIPLELKKMGPKEKKAGGKR